DDARTVLSSMTEDLPEPARRAILDVCSMICGQIGEQIRQGDRDTFLDALPNIIKSFAIRLGYHSPHALSQSVMVFVYSRHRDIAATLRSMIYRDEGDDEGEAAGHPKVQGMSVDDKIAMWRTEFQVEPSQPVPSDCFVGVPENNDDHVDVSMDPELSSYTETIRCSQAYQWLIQSLSREPLFQWDDAHPRIMVEEVRQKVTRDLPSIISRKSKPNSHTVKFTLPWPPLRHRLNFESVVRAAEPGRALFDSVVLIGSSDEEIQATTVEGYVWQTWGAAGIDTLNALQSLIGDEYRTNPVEAVPSSQESPAIRATLGRDRALVSVFVTGPACLVGECAEQLAWLISALRSNQESRWFIVNNKPVVEKVPSTQGVPCWSLACAVEERESELAVTLLSHWIGQPVCRVVARGFPTLRRPEFCPGIEISSSMFQSFCRTQDLSNVKAGTVLSAAPGTLKLVKRVGPVYVWHIFQPGMAPACPCVEALSLRFGDNLGVETLPSHGNDQNRHILGDCASTEKWLKKTPSPALGVHRSPSCDTNLSNSAWSVSSKPPSIETAVLWKEETTSTLAGGSLEASVESDMLSISDTSDLDWNKISDKYAGVSPVIGAVARSLYQEYRNTRFRGDDPPHGNGDPPDSGRKIATLANSLPSDSEAPNDSPDNNATGSSSFGQVSSNSMGSGRATRQYRGKATQNEKNCDENGDQEKPPPPSRKRTRKDGCEPSFELLACPFWKLDPSKFRSCFKSELCTVSRVKQHLVRKHVLASYCDRCKAIFPDEESKKGHLRLQPPCLLNEEAGLDGMTPQQHLKVSRRSNPTLAEEERWFAIWDILFEEQQLPRPRSAYMDSDLSEDMAEYRNYVQRCGHDVLARELKSAGIHLSLQTDHTSAEGDRVQDTAVREALRQSLDFLYDDWLASRRVKPALSSRHVSRELGSNALDAPSSKRQKVSRRSAGTAPSSAFADS
ncbi:hypothetical protein V8F06_005409, partial [Rhypophila decipiens]